VVKVPPYDWKVGPARRTENFVDFSHFAWVHDGVLASRDDPVVPEHVVYREGGELRTQIVVEEPATTSKTRTLSGDSTNTTVPGERNYRIPIPFTVWLQQKMPGGDTFVLFMACMPIGPKLSRSFTFNARTFGHDADDEVFIKFQQEIAEADRVVAESQRPEELPVDLREEMYVRGADAVSVEYRRWLLELVKEHEAAEV
jgi:vanillate O-demethylase monooxygenase subunit